MAKMQSAYISEGIAKTPLLTAEEEAEFAKTIEIGLYAEHILSGDVTLAERGKHAKRPSKSELEFLVDEGRRAMQHFVTANLRLVVSVARKYGRSQMPSWIWSRKAIPVLSVQSRSSTTPRGSSSRHTARGGSVSRSAAGSPSRVGSSGFPYMWPSRSIRLAPYEGPWNGDSGGSRDR